jgi:hypothetical protein
LNIRHKTSFTPFLDYQIPFFDRYGQSAPIFSSAFPEQKAHSYDPTHTRDHNQTNRISASLMIDKKAASGGLTNHMHAIVVNTMNPVSQLRA